MLKCTARTHNVLKKYTKLYMFHLGIHASQFCSTMVKGSDFATDCKRADRRWYKRRWWLFFQSSPASKRFFIKERFEIEQTRFFSILQVGCGKYYLLNKQWVVGLGSLIDLRPRKIGRQGYKKVSDIRLSSLKSYCVLRWCTWKW